MPTIISALIPLVFVGCVTDAMIRDGASTAADCSLHTTVSCAMQSLVDCSTPKEKTGPGWKGYALCLFDRAKDCQLRGLGRCAAAGVIAATGSGLGVGSFNSLSMVSVGPPPCDLQAAEACVNDVTIETRDEAIDAVAGCYRVICSVRAAGLD